jgi:hypothetical protein
MPWAVAAGPHLVVASLQCLPTVSPHPLATLDEAKIFSLFHSPSHSSFALPPAIRSLPHASALCRRCRTSSPKTSPSCASEPHRAGAPPRSAVCREERPRREPTPCAIAAETASPSRVSAATISASVLCTPTTHSPTPTTAGPTRRHRFPSGHEHLHADRHLRPPSGLAVAATSFASTARCLPTPSPATSTSPLACHRRFPAA